MSRPCYHPGALVIVPEKLRLLGYAGFWVLVMTGVVLTRAFSGIDMNETMLMEAFGYNNICAYFDAPPSTYVLPFLWAGTILFAKGLDRAFLLLAAVVPMVKAGYLVYAKGDLLENVQIHMAAERA